MFSANESNPVVQPQKGAQKTHQAKVAPWRYKKNNPLMHIPLQFTKNFRSHPFTPAIIPM